VKTHPFSLALEFLLGRGMVQFPSSQRVASSHSGSRVKSLVPKPNHAKSLHVAVGTPCQQ
jgi:hypothetical protein